MSEPERPGTSADPSTDPLGWVRAILRCPTCHGTLSDAVHDAAPELVCDECGLAYPVQDGIPVLLPTEARHP